MLIWKICHPRKLQEVPDIIGSNGGRINQKDLRSKLSYSEAKVSLIVSDLENRGLVEKFKKGRGNIIIIPDDQRLLWLTVHCSVLSYEFLCWFL
ncbi:helix-turn-helix transcriptional regulator [Methanococcoides methylutens]|uniref:helix-turn-helix transcriptional regulator n=1 Tax=Methanococcoides methylutens TaxID=2226 RepID=UPI00404434BD